MDAKTAESKYSDLFKSIKDFTPIPSAPQFNSESGFAAMQRSAGDWRNQKAGQENRLKDTYEWVNRQNMYDPSAWASALGIGSGTESPSMGGVIQPILDMSNRFEAGLSANEGRLNALLTDPNSIQNTAAYKFRVNQGLDMLNRQLGARGLLNSGNRLAETTKYGQDMASQEYDSQFGRLRDLVQSYSQNWIGDKNANTQRYSSELSAKTQRDIANRKILGDLMMKGMETGGPVGGGMGARVNSMSMPYKYGTQSNASNNSPFVSAELYAGNPQSTRRGVILDKYGKVSGASYFD